MTTERRGRGDVIATAFELLDEAGLEALTLREVARRLGAHLNTVSYQVKTKARLRELMADAMLGSLTLDGLTGDPAARVKEILRRYRSSLLSHRDGAGLVAGTVAVEKNTLRVGNAIIEALLESGADKESAVRTFWGLHYFLLGLVQEEQGLPAQEHKDVLEVIHSGNYPAMAEVGDIILNDPFVCRFEFGLDAFLRHLEPGESMN
ncbi:Transcriptional regulator, TetR-family [Corynebacterium glyciniphilum AJ 3170]|uniref:Transcriptional regulator, TetR-family n=1 Tax=Corynebacterium glyciniphilum AJ 3170 TaxID=1404245 RepID=X5EA91_9CORY|nr:TetR/AcrR family transcriptional regulator C-terminal domain-containing protein [Corynebacterium glyciniphilum]AHW63576.1 Transcriptional regulator, TetR-family [Corynebacterium glyciniphilum AJ 3170]